MKDKISIISDGTSIGTHVFNGDDEIKGITKIEFLPMSVGELLQVRLTLINVAINVNAKVVL